MDTTILEVVLGLALIYAVLSVLVMQLQTEVGGNLLNYRANVLHDLVLQACGNSQDLKEQVMAQPLVFALYREQQAEQRFLRWDKGPSAIPPALFAKALLSALNGGSAPALTHASPALFMASATPPMAAAPAADATTTAVAKTDNGRLRVWQALQTLLPGRDNDWPGFEAAIAAWFSDIGDRSEGWFKRKTSRWTLVLTLLLVVALNVDTFHIANTLATDPALRLGLADLATRIDSQRRSDAAGKPDEPAPPSTAMQPMQQLASRMTDAITRLNSAWRSDPAIGNFQGDLAPVSLGCSIVRGKSGLDRITGAGDQADTTWQLDIHNDPAVVAAVKGEAASAAAAAASQISQGKPPKMLGGMPAPTASLSNSDVWLRVLPIVQAKVEVAQLLPAPDAQRVYQRGFECVAQVSSWVRSATVHSDRANVRAQMQDAAAALESVKSALLTLSERQPPALSLRRAIAADPGAFTICNDSAGGNRSAFDACLDRELRSGWHLPLFWGGSAMRAQFCRVEAGARPAGTTGGQFCSAPAFQPDARLGLPMLHLVQQAGWGPWAAIPGWLATLLFVSLGAPFWFDLISKVVRLRTAGSVRDAAADGQRGRGTQPLPSTDAGGNGNTRTGTDSDPPFSDSRNPFEDTLTPAAILRLQQKLPADMTGRLDLQTRAALRSWCSTNGQTPVEELHEELYRLIVGRASAPATAGSGGGRLLPGQAHDQVPTLATALMAVLRQNGRIAAGSTLFDADLRALAVLFRYHQQRLDGKAPQDCAVLQQPNSNPAALDQIDEALAAQITAAASAGQRRTLEPPCWMDWAIGELGQVEHDARSRAGSNPRICAYLDAGRAAAGDGGDHTPWCGAFVAWVLRSYDTYRQAHRLDAERSGDPLAGAAQAAWTMPLGGSSANWPLRADTWKTWGQPRSNWQTDARFGDVVLLAPQGRDSSGHVAFFVHCDGRRIWLLGGNQTSGSRVSVQPWDIHEVVAVRHADLPV